MAEPILNDDDTKQIKQRGMEVEEVLSQIEVFKKGFPFCRLERPCTIGDGITSFHREDPERLGEVFKSAALSGRTMKFVPASGAASRMFKLLLSFSRRDNQMDERGLTEKAQRGDRDHEAFLQFIRGIKRFAFFRDLESSMAGKGFDMGSLLSEGQYKDILEHMLGPEGLNLAYLPKGLIKFHRYGEKSRTAFEEHLVEAAGYVQDRNKTARIHFTVSPRHEKAIKEHIGQACNRFERLGIRYEIGLSVQQASTATVAVDLHNRPFRDRDGRLVFRPGGHGALLKNLNDLQGDIVFIKNIDNVVPDRLKPQTILYKKALGGYLVELQEDIFGYLEVLSRRDADDPTIDHIMEFALHKLSIIPPQGIEKGSRGDKIDFLVSKLTRPLRVCGMVKNEGEPGGGPFWVSHGDGSMSLQIVEASQIDMGSAEQRAIWESATHFNPVDLVCGVRDYLGRPFNLMKFRDPDTGFISLKSKGGRDLKALEHPGLWNGSMANWNTAFLEVPIITFNPVKTVLDLLRKEHQPE